MCDCFDEEFEDLPVAAEEQEPAPQVMPLQVIRERK
jgi:hypothetical protein